MPDDDMDRLMRKLEALGRSPAVSRRNSTRQYGAARGSRLTSGWSASNSSADAELSTSLTNLRSRSRALVRDASYAKRARVLVVNNVIGSGIGLQCQVKNARGELNQRVNTEIEDVFAKHSRSDSFHTGGRLSRMQFERLCMAQVFEAGEVFIREHYQAFGESKIPYSLEVIEAERIADEFSSPVAAANGNQVRMGVEVDRFGRPVAYYIRERHPSELRWGNSPDRFERVSADQIIHLAVIDRWPQTRGEPWLHAAARRLNDMDGYSEAEIVRARVQASTVGAIETPEDASSFGEEQDDGTVELEVEPGVFKRLSPGEKLNALAPSSPNPALDPFMRYMLREVASGLSVSYASLSSDYSQSNYSSSRLALLDDRDLWKFLQVWFISEFRERVHRHFLKQAVLAGEIKSIPLEQYAVAPEKFEAARYKPRGWSWIDPTSEVEAYKEAVKAGFLTVGDVVAMTNGGQDLEDVLEGRRNELDAMGEKDLEFDTSPEFYMADAKAKDASAKAATSGPPQSEGTPDPSKGAPQRSEPVARMRVAT